GAADLLDGRAPAAVAVERGECQLGVRTDDGQGVVEIVGDAGGQAPDGLGLLRMPQLRLELAALPDVLYGADETPRLALCVADKGAAAADPADLAGRSDDPVLEIVRAALLERRPDGGMHRRPVVVVDARFEFLDRAGEAVGRHADDAVRFGRPDHAARAVELDDPAADTS